MAERKGDWRVQKSDAEWRAQLTPEQYRITRQHGTEPPFTGPYLDEKEPGLYRCVCCDAPLFRSDSKFESGTGWPSFYEPVGPDVITERVDSSHGMRRVEILCSNCGAHLGHVFPDGPDPTGLRYCTNGNALEFEPEE
jgi:peptide-methionine (R)-S-oxide reductase